jgi:hypothetical protein
MYDNLSKYEMNLRQGKVDISQGAGNALKCSVDFIKAFGFADLPAGKEPTLRDASLEILKWQKFFLENTNNLIKTQYEIWKEKNDPILREEFGIDAIEESKAEVKTIPVDTPTSSFWKKVGEIAVKENKPEINDLAKNNGKTNTPVQPVPIDDDVEGL